MIRANEVEQTVSHEQDAGADMEMYQDAPEERMGEENRKDSMLDVDAPETSIDTALDIEASSEDTMPDTTTSGITNSDLSMTDAASSSDDSSEPNIQPSSPRNEEVVNSSESNVAQELTLDTAPQKVFATHGLVEQIILKLPDVKMIALVRRTNKTFHDVTRRSFKIRQRLSKAMQSKEPAVGYAAWLRRRRLSEMECKARIEPSRHDWASVRRYELD